MAEASSTDDVITLRIRFKSETLERFIERYGGDLGPEQVFVRTRQPLAIGTPIAFDFTLNDGSALLSGRGTVAWSRSQPDAAGPAGMGVQFTSLPAASWQVLRKVLAARGETAQAQDDQDDGEGDDGNEPTTVRPPMRRTTPVSGPAVTKGQAPEEAERTEVARMPPTFFEPTAQGGSRNLDRARGRTNQAPTPRTLDVRPDERPGAGGLREEFENLSLEEVEEVTGPLTRPTARRTPAGAPAIPTTPPGRNGDAAWRTHVPQAGAATSPPRGTASIPAWTQPTPPRGVPRVSAKELAASVPPPATTPGPRATYPYDEPVSSTAPTLPATAAVLLYDPDDPHAPLQSAGKGQGSGAPAPSVPFTVAPPPPASAPVLAAPMAPGNAYQEGFYPPAEPAGGYPEADFDPAEYAGPGRPTGGRSTVGRIGPAISPEEMALAATAVRGMEGEAPVFPGMDQEQRPPGTAKIWLALILAAGGVIAAFLWLVPMVPSDFIQRMFGTPEPATEPAAPDNLPGAAQDKIPGAGAPAGTAPGSAPTGAAPAEAPAGGPAAAPAGAPASPPPAAERPAAAPEKAPEPAPRRNRPAAVIEGTDAPAPRPRRRRREPAEVIAEAESRGKPDEAAATGPAALPAPAAGTTPAVPEAAPTEGAAAEDIYWLSVRSTPTGADVIIDGQAEGKTPFTRRIFDPSRNYALVVRKPGFTSLERTVTGASEWTKRGNVRTLTVTARLEPAPGAEPAPAPTPPAPATGKTNPFDEPNSVTPPPVPRP